MRRRDFLLGTAGLAAFAQDARAQQSARTRRIAIIHLSPTDAVSATGLPSWQTFFAELRDRGGTSKAGIWRQHDIVVPCRMVALTFPPPSSTVHRT